MNTETSNRLALVIAGAIAGAAAAIAVSILFFSGGSSSLSAEDVARGWAAGSAGVEVVVTQSDLVPTTDGTEVTKVIVDDDASAPGALAVYVVTTDGGFLVVGAEPLPNG